jgi:hypothetical protein
VSEDKSQSGLPVLKDVDVKSDALQLWLEQKHPFQEPIEVSSRKERVTGRLRLLYQEWRPPNDFTGSDRLPISQDSFALITKSLNLPRCFLFDFVSGKHVPMRLKKMKTDDGNLLGVSSKASILKLGLIS